MRVLGGARGDVGSEKSPSPVLRDSLRIRKEERQVSCSPKIWSQKTHELEVERHRKQAFKLSGEKEGRDGKVSVSRDASKRDKERGKIWSKREGLT